MQTRVVMRIELTPQAKQRLTDLCQEKGMTQVRVASQLVDWFANQPPMIQAAILGHYPREIEDYVFKLILSKLAKSKKAKSTSKRQKP